MIKRLLFWLTGALTGMLVMFLILWALHYRDKHPYRPHFADMNDTELLFLFEGRYNAWIDHVSKGADASSQWNELRRLGEILEEIKHRKVGDMDHNDSLYDKEQKDARNQIESQNRGPGI